MVEAGATVLLPPPLAGGRVFEAGRRVRLGDVSPSGRLRLDAVARYLQDVARDDSADAAVANTMNWVVRRTLIEVTAAPRFEEWIDLATWCSGYGLRWAERRTRLRGDRGSAIEAVTVWVHVDVSGAPLRLPHEFHEVWGGTAAGRRVSARATLPKALPPDCGGMIWPVRHSDLDLMGHMNNAAHWVPVEEATARSGGLPSRLRAELEHRAAISGDREVELRWRQTDPGVAVWLVSGAVVISTARVRPLVGAG